MPLRRRFDCSIATEHRGLLDRGERLSEVTDFVLRSSFDGSHVRHCHRAVFARVAERLDEAGQLLVGDFVSGDGEAAERTGDGPAEHDRRCDRERSGRKCEEPIGDDVAVCGGLLLTRLREQVVLDRGLDLATEVERRDAVLLPRRRIERDGRADSRGDDFVDTVGRRRDGGTGDRSAVELLLLGSREREEHAELRLVVELRAHQ